MRSVILPRTRRSASAAMLAAALAAACGDPSAHVQLVPLGDHCARPTDANAVRITAYAAGGEVIRPVALTETVSIADFPADTEQIGVEVFVGGGAIGAQGKSAPLVFDALADRAVIPVLMAPPDGFCELPGMIEARARPLVARAGDGALVVGGIGPAGPLSTAEYYDPTTATFVSVEVPTALVNDQGFTGAALATLPDGRVALVGGPSAAFVVFDPATHAFVTDPTLIARRAFHAAIASGDGEVLVAGGCSEVTALACAGVARVQSLRYPQARLSLPEPSAILMAGYRISPQLFDLGVQLDGSRRFLLAGGTGVPARADRFALGDVNAQVVPGGMFQAAALDGGAVLTAFGDDAAADPDPTVMVIAPGAAAAFKTADAPPLQGVRLIGLEDGRIVGFGGGSAAMGRVVTYDPIRDAWTSAKVASIDQTGPLTSPSLARLTDGTVLVVGGAVSPRAWLYRPSLTGPASGSVTATPTSDSARVVLTAPDPASVTRTAQAWRLTTPAGAAMARALVGGPRMATGSVLATVHVVAGGVALIAQQTAPGRAIIAELAPGSPARLIRIEDGTDRVVCTASAALGAFDPAAPVTLRLAIQGGEAQVSLGGSEVLACPLAATERGAWGIASLGAGAQVTVDSVTVARGRPAT